MSARSLLPGLQSPHPLGRQLPALYQDDGFAQRLTAAFDEALAPVLYVLDSLEAYFDPRLAPDDFLAWLGRWLGLAFDETWPLERRRTFVARAVELYRRRGTLSGLAEELELSTGIAPELSESGGTTWSQTPGASTTGSRSSFAGRSCSPGAASFSFWPG